MITQVLPLPDLTGYLATPGLIDPNSMVAMVGDLRNLPEQRVAVVNSRQHRTPYADDPWLTSTLNALEQTVPLSSAVVSSVGMITWEWTVWNTVRLDGYLLILVPRGKLSNLPARVDQLIGDFDIDPHHTVFLMPFHTAQKPIRKAVYPERDRWLFAVSHHILPIAIRPSGTLSKLLNEPSISRRIDNSFRTPHTLRKAPIPNLPQIVHQSGGRRISTQVKGEWNYLTHWTRSCHGPWQGERKTDFYHDLHQSDSGYPRDGFHTLKRILKEGKIRGSDRLLRGPNAMVSLTAQPPTELLRIIRWRPGFIRWNFEPYGISIKRDKLQSLGARPVTYGTREKYLNLDPDQQPFFQRLEMKGKDWSVEQEWRFPGDIDLTKLSQNNALIWVMYPHQVAEIDQISPFPVRTILQ
jgi:hypothetical protein